MQWHHTQRSRLPLWLPVFYGCGITLQNHLPNSTKSYFLVSTLILIALVLFVYSKQKAITYLLAPFAFIIFGITIMQQNTLQKSHAPIIEKNLGTTWIRANIDKIEQREHGKRIWLSNLDLWNPEKRKFPAFETPKRIRLNIRTAMDETISPNDRVTLKAIISPPPARATYPNAYDFSYTAFYNEIGGTGYSISPVTHYKKHAPPTPPSFEPLRHAITKRIVGSTPEESQHIATALLTGKRGAIDKHVLTTIRNTGLGHLLAISGLHMALVMAGIFTIFRILLSTNETICLNYNTKKIASCAAIFAGLIYLAITGFPISAQRAYIMTAIVFIAVLIDRNGISMRTLAFSAIIVLTIAPYSLLTVSFQMSFAAVITLIAFFERPIPALGSDKPTLSIFERLTHTYHDDIIAPSKFLKIKKYIIGMAYSSTIAGLATMPFAIYHFGHVSSYSVFANLLAIPLTSLWIMPWGILSLIVMPFGLEQYPLLAMHYGIQLLLMIASYINTWADANILVSHIPASFVITFSFSILWLCNWQRGIFRLCGLIPLIIYALWYFPLAHRTPDFVINESGTLYAIKGENGEYFFSSLQKARYARSQWLQMFGKKRGWHVREISKHSPNTIYTCDNQRCYYETNGKKITLITLAGVAPNTEDCNQSYVVISPHNNTRCAQTKSITKADLKQNGSHVLFLTSPSKIINVEDEKHHINNRHQ